MKKIIISACFIGVLLSGCGQPVQNTSNEDLPSMFSIVESTKLWSVVYHRETKVMYAVSGGLYNGGNFTLLVNSDGSPMLWEG